MWIHNIWREEPRRGAENCRTAEAFQALPFQARKLNWADYLRGEAKCLEFKLNCNRGNQKEGSALKKQGIAIFDSVELIA